MKKRLSLFLVATMMLTSFVGCAAPGGSASNAPFQAKDVSNYEFGLVNDAYAEDPLSNTMAAFDAATSEAITEDNDVRFSNTYSYEEMAECFTLVTELNASNMSEYFSMETVSDDEQYDKVIMNGTEGYYVSGAVVMKFMDKNGGDIQCTYDPLSGDGYINSCFKNDKSWTTEKLNTVELQTSVSVYTFNPTEGMWTDYNGEQVLCIYTNDGSTTVVEVFENKPIEISYLLRVLSEKGLLNTAPTPDAEGQGGTSTPAPTPDGGAAEQTPAPAPEPTPTYSYPFMGRYFIAVVNYGSASQQYVNQGMYIDENYIYYNNNGQIFTEPLTAYTFTDDGNGYYTYINEYEDGFSYHANGDYINMFSGGYDGYTLIPVDKSVYDAIGTY